MTKRQLQTAVRAHYKANKRAFPWRQTKNPYLIFVSEVMLQQTQTSRVVEKYQEWLHLFPTVEKLADAPLQKVLGVWKGLGYNRRALNLQRASQVVVHEHRGTFPKTYEEILKLPGVGPYTAGAVMAFAYNVPFPIIETNIRTVFLHFLFKDQKGVTDKEILKLVEQTLPEKNVREWYYALMDYGVHLKKLHGNANTRSAHYTKQSTFKGSNRELRSKILQAIAKKPQTQSGLEKQFGNGKKNLRQKTVAENINDLQAEGFIKINKNKYSIA